MGSIMHLFFWIFEIWRSYSTITQFLWSTHSSITRGCKHRFNCITKIHSPAYQSIKNRPISSWSLYLYGQNGMLPLPSRSSPFIHWEMRTWSGTIVQTRRQTPSYKGQICSRSETSSQSCRVWWRKVCRPFISDRRGNNCRCSRYWRFLNKKPWAMAKYCIFIICQNS